MMKPLTQEVWLALRQSYQQQPRSLQKFSHVAVAILAGMLFLAMWGWVLGALGGYGMSLVLPHPLLNQRAWFEGRINLIIRGAETGWFGGTLLGLTGFSLTLWRNPDLLHIQPFLTLSRNIIKYSLIGIAIGVINLVPIGALFACYLADNNIELDTYYWFQSAWFLPPSMIAAEGALNGYLWGITLGFSWGTIYALYQARKKPGLNLTQSIAPTISRKK